MGTKVRLRKTGKYGKGVFAARKIRKGEVVAVFDGPVYDKHFDGWTRDLLLHTIQVGPQEWRDSSGLARFLNHSCEPNCGIKDFFKIVAMRTIHPGEEITWDYEMTEKSSWFRMRCRCGTSSCRKVIGNFNRMPKHIRKKYKGYISEWLVNGARKKTRGKGPA